MARNPQIIIEGKDNASKAIKSINSELSGLTSSIGKVAGAFGVGFGVGALVSGFNSVITALDGMDKRAQSAGASSAVAIANLSRAALDSDVSVQQLDKALTKINVTAVEAADGNKKSAEMFRRLGISIKDATGNVRASDEIFKDLADRFSRFRDGAEKTAYATALFGEKVGPQLVVMLNQGRSGLEQYNQVTQETIDRAKALQKQKEILQAQIAKTAAALVGELAPALTSILTTFNDAIERTNSFSVALNRLFDGDRRDEAALLKMIASVERQLRDLDDAWILPETRRQYASGLLSNLRKELDLVRGSAQRATEEGLNRFLSAKSALNADVGRGRSGLGVAPAPPGPASTDSAAKAAERFLENLRKQVQRAEHGEFAMRRWEAAQLGVAKAAEPYIRQLEEAKNLQEAIALFVKDVEQSEKARAEAFAFTRGLNERVQSLQLEVELIGKSELAQRQLTAAREIDAQVLERVRQLEDPAEIGRAFDEGEAAKRRVARELEAAAVKNNQKSLDDLLDSINIETALIGKSNVERQRAILLLDLEKRGIEAGTKAYDDAIVKINEITDALTQQEGFKRVQEEIDDVSRSVAGMVGEFAKTGDIKSFFESLTGYLLDLTTRILIVEPLAKQLRDTLGNMGSSSGGGWLEAAANVFGGLFGGARAFGGPVMAGVPYMVGERGREIFVPRQSGQIIPNGGGLASVQNTFVLPSGAVTRETQNQIAATAARSVASVSRRGFV